MQKQNLGGQARLFLKQSLARIEYLLFVFMILQHYCKSYPKLGVAKLNGKNFPFLNFSTRSLVCFTELYSLFYFEGKKVIPYNIFELLTIEGLAHWIYLRSDIQAHLRCVRARKSYGLYINVDGYTIQDIVLLINVLIIRFQLDCSLHRLKQNKYHIYIKNKSMPLLLKGIRPHIS